MDIINTSALSELINGIAEEAVKKQEKQNTIGKTIGINDFRNKYCNGKSPSWVRTYIFDAFPETDFKNGGFVMNNHGGSGSKTFIWEHQAAEWIEKKKRRIDWTEKIKQLKKA